ncbi:hypothetical protein KIL84_015120 [Mauremys mutica]|uniref:Uncharacterized protein n=1 Tax=Mauremys mutica TaxID=74926 RepID=A0A9D3WNB4_9SAUR|nr:hypothetical protein KIL84_015120 [Mauremys mutica]
MVIRIIPEKKKNAEADAVPSMGAADREFVAVGEQQATANLLLITQDRSRACEFVTKPPSTPSVHRHLDRHEGPMMDPCALISTRPEVLSVENIAKVRNRLAFLGGLSRPMEECLDHALLTFIREAGCLQENAWLVTRCEGQQLVFVSGQGESNIQVSYGHGVP